MIRAARLALACGGLLCSVSAAAFNQRWPEIQERSFSPKVAQFLKPLPAFQYRAYQSGDDANIASLKGEVEQCTSAGPIGPCIGMILDGMSYLGSFDENGNSVPSPYVEQAILAGEKMFPVDLLVVPGVRRIAGSHKIVADGLRRLERLADASGQIHGERDLRTVRRRIAYDTALWRAGGLPIRTATSAEIAETSGKDGELAGRAKVLSALLSEYSPKNLEFSTEALRLLGNVAAPVVATHYSKIGQYRQAERYALDGYAAVLAARGLGHPTTLAAAAILTKAYSDLGKNELALPLAREVAAARLADPYVNEIQLLEAIMTLAALAPTNERATLLRQALSIADGSKAKPQWPVAAQLMREGSELLPSDLGGSIGMSNARTLDEEGARSLMNVTSRAHTLLGMDILATDPEGAKGHFRKAIQADGSNRMPTFFLATALIVTSRTLLDLVTGPDRIPSMLWELDEAMGVPVDHPERILNNMLLAQYYRRASVDHAPEYARKAADGASTRVRSIEVQDQESASEASQLKSVFATQVQSNWDAVQSLN